MEILNSNNLNSFSFAYCDLSKLTSSDNQVFGFSNTPDSQFNCNGNTVNVIVKLSRADPATGEAVLRAYAKNQKTSQSKELSAKFNFLVSSSSVDVSGGSSTSPSWLDTGRSSGRKSH